MQRCTSQCTSDAQQHLRPFPPPTSRLERVAWLVLGSPPALAANMTKHLFIVFRCSVLAAAISSAACGNKKDASKDHPGSAVPMANPRIS